MYTTINTVYCLSELSSIWNHLRIHIWLKGCSKSPQRSRPCMLHNFRFQSVIVIVNCSLYWMPHTQDGKPKTQKKHKSRWCSSRTCWSYPPKSRKSLSPAKVQQLEVRNMCLPIFYPDLWMPWRFWLWTSGYLSSVVSLTSKLVWSLSSFLWGGQWSLFPSKSSDWLKRLLLDSSQCHALETAGDRLAKTNAVMQNPNVDRDHSQRLRNMPHLYTFVEYHHLNMRTSTCHVCLPYNWFICHLVSTAFQPMPCVRKPPDLEGSPQLWHHFLSATGDGICYPAITKFSSCRTESISTSAKIILN